jgi:hypothetical protein
MTEIAKHIRIFEKNPTDDLVEKRTAAIKELAANFGKISQVTEILRLASDLAAAATAKGALPDARANEIESLIRTQSSSFVREGQELQLLTCSLLAALQYIDASGPSKGQWTRPDVLAIGLWSALSFQKPRSESRIEQLRSELIERSRALVMNSSSKARDRESVPDPSPKVTAGDTPDKVAEQSRKAIKQAVDVLRTNSALDREELDLLWWVLSDWSTLLGQKLSSTPPAIAAVFAGVETAQFMRRLPHEAYKHVVLRNIDAQHSMSLEKLIEGLGDQCKVLATRFRDDENLSACPRVFPLLTAICSNNASGPEAKVARSIEDWGSRALLESSILHIATLPEALV